MAVNPDNKHWRAYDVEYGGGLDRPQPQNSSGANEGTQEGQPQNQTNPQEEKSEGASTQQRVVVPDLTEYVLGFREWILIDSRLHSLTWGYIWKGGEEQATITSNETGLYAYHNPYRITRGPRHEGGREWQVPGSVLAWGDIRVHKDGFRASNMKILYLAFDPNWSYQSVMDYRQWAKGKYGCEVVNCMELAARSEEVAKPVPEALRYPEGYSHPKEYYR